MGSCYILQDILVLSLFNTLSLPDSVTICVSMSATLYFSVSPQFCLSPGRNEWQLWWEITVTCILPHQLKYHQGVFSHLCCFYANEFWRCPPMAHPHRLNNWLFNLSDQACLECLPHSPFRFVSPAWVGQTLPLSLYLGHRVWWLHVMPSTFNLSRGQISLGKWKQPCSCARPLKSTQTAVGKENIGVINL